MDTPLTRFRGPRPERWWDGTSWFHFRARRLAREEVDTGDVEVLTFRAAAVWTMNRCDGAPCCPNDWLVETEDGELVWFSSWNHLQRREGLFPGKQLSVKRWPRTKRVAAVTVTGEPVRFGGFDDGFAARVLSLLKSEMLDHWLRCHVLPRGSLTPPSRADGA
jgi:hypothetical protein